MPTYWAVIDVELVEQDENYSIGDKNQQNREKISKNYQYLFPFDEVKKHQHDIAMKVKQAGVSNIWFRFLPLRQTKFCSWWFGSNI